MIHTRPRLRRIGIYALGVGLFFASAVGVPVLIFRARRPRPRPYLDEQRERNRLSALLCSTLPSR